LSARSVTNRVSTAASTVIKPLIDRSYRTLPERANTAIMGSSMGGLC
jgi:predicted alpha/beta superfamily hydrolase